jgi:hypothetical protein
MTENRNVFLYLYAAMLAISGALDFLGLSPPGHSQFETFVGLTLFFLAIVVSAIADEVIGGD